ncbi:N-acetylmuramoyl-L-alanine amidase [Paenibacillus koleovorans]|uniref:N-acetylmuramoyl-L-alanine amidase n=1 Tax=Paenibacillus koleovorans TaxID=121608 RepID=UPI000FDC18EF|nr:N-acetylmuramoyl-L-alanine amidase [Paenibacillus koleovorans]
MKILKALPPLLLLIVIAFLLPARTEAASVPNAVQLYLNGAKLNPEVAPRIVNDITIVPLRIISENLGADVKWIPDGQRIQVKQGKSVIELQIDNPVVSFNGVSEKLEAPPVIVDDNTLVPVRFISERLGLKVSWDNLSYSVSLFSHKEESASSGNGSDPDPGTNGTQSGSTNGGTGTTPQKPDGTGPTKPDGTGPSKPDGTGSSKPDGTSPPKPDGTGPSKPGDTNGNAGTTTGNNIGNGSTGAGSAGTGSTGSGSIGTGSTGTGSTGTNTGSNNGSGTGSIGSSGSSGPGASTKPPTNPALLTLSRLDFTGEVLTIQTTKPVTPKLSTLSDPERIIIDLPGVVLAGSTIVDLMPRSGEFAVKHPYVQKVRYSQRTDNPAEVRIVLDMKQKTDYKLTEDKATNTIKLQPVVKRFKVYIDAGHGGSDPGALSLSNRHEKEFTLATEAKLAALLKQIPDLQVVESRTEDVYPDLETRVDEANKLGADLFISIHANKFSNPSVNGLETYYYRPDSLAFANLVHGQMIAATGINDRGVRIGNFKVIRETTMPAVLIESGYLSNKEDEARLYSEDYQNRLAAAIAASVKKYLFGE